MDSVGNIVNPEHGSKALSLFVSPVVVSSGLGQTVVKILGVDLFHLFLSIFKESWIDDSPEKTPTEEKFELDSSSSRGHLSLEDIVPVSQNNALWSSINHEVIPKVLIKDVKFCIVSAYKIQDSEYSVDSRGSPDYGEYSHKQLTSGLPKASGFVGSFDSEILEEWDSIVILKQSLDYGSYLFNVKVFHLLNFINYRNL